MLPTILIVLITPIVVILAIAATRPNTFRVERRTHIDAEPARVFALVDDFRRWPAWSPWEKLDPALTRTYSGASSGAGAKYAWAGNKKVGEGRMEILETTPPSRIVIRLEFLKPWQATNTTEFTFARSASGTDVNWAMVGTSPFMFKVMGIFMPMDKLVGKDFERGLASMKAAAEA